MFNQKEMLVTGSGVSALVLMLIGLLTTKWSVGSVSGVDKADKGLWRQCKTNVCESTDENTMLWVIRILLILSTLMMSVGLYLHFTQSQHTQLATVLLALSGVMAIVSCVLWATDSDLTPSSPPGGLVKISLGYSWYLVLFGGVLALGSAGVEELMSYGML